MKTLSEFIKESLIQEAETIKSEKDFREAARAKFEEVFGDELDEEKMKKTIDGFLEDNKDLVDEGEWGELIGMFNQSFAPEKTNESLLTEGKDPKKGAKAYDYNGDEVKIIDIFSNKGLKPADYGDIDEFLDDYDETGSMRDYLDNDDDFKDDLENGKAYMVAVKLKNGDTAVYSWGSDGVHYDNK